MEERLRISLLKTNMIVRGPILPEPVQVIVTIPMGDSIKLIGKGLRTGQVMPFGRSFVCGPICESSFAIGEAQMRVQDL